MTVKRGSKVAIHWNTSFQKGMAYVMLSRTETLEDIQIIESKSKFTTECIKANEDALRESNRIHDEFEALKQERMFFLMKHTTIAYLNVRRLLPHLIDIKTDPILMESDIITLGETWLKPADTVTISGFETIEVKTAEGGKGLSTFVKSGNQITFHKFLNERFSAILIQTYSMDVLFMYLSKNFDWSALKEILVTFVHTKKDLAIIGDMNIDFMTENHNLVKFLDEKGFVQMIQKPTYESGSLLDHIYVNESLLSKAPSCSQLAVYYSDHDIVFLHVPKE